MIVNALHSNMLTSPSRTISGKVELYNGSTLTSTFLGTDKLASFTVNRAGDTKFFGYGICQELELKLIDKNRGCTVCKDNILKTYLGTDGDYLSTTPKFYVTDVIRDENTNALTVKASDIIYKTRLHTISEIIQHPTPYTISGLATTIAQWLGLTLLIVNVNDSSFDTYYEKGGNFGGDELVRAVLDDIAEATQTIYYIDSNDNLVFKRLDVQGASVITIDKRNYFTLKSKDALVLSTIVHTTELGDNLPSNVIGEGITQYVRDNALWNLRTDLDTLLNNAIAAVGGLSIVPFNCDWRANYLLELGDKIAIEGKDDVVTTFLLNDKYTYNGGLSGTSSWEMPPPQEETATNPTNLGDKINQTFARVDKLEQKITLYVGEVVEKVIDDAIGDSLSAIETIEENVSELQVTTTGISAAVSSVETTTQTAIDALEQSVQKLTNEVNFKLSKEDVTITIESTLAEGVDKVVTASKKYTFDDTGLNVGSSDSSINTTVTEDGMRISRSGEEVLRADNEGVKAEDLHATTYLIIGDNSRLEDWQENYTACFWLGGN